MSFTVYAGAISGGSCGTSSADAANCAIVVQNANNSSDSGATLISFGNVPQVSVTPAAALQGGQVVKVSGTGLPPNASFAIIECLTTAASVAGCDVGWAEVAATTGTGVLPSTKIAVATGTVGNGTCGTSVSDTNGCLISVVETIGGTPVAVAGSQAIGFGL